MFYFVTKYLEEDTVIILSDVTQPIKMHQAQSAQSLVQTSSHFSVTKVRLS